MLRYLPAPLAIATTLTTVVAVSASAQERSTVRAIADCMAPATPYNTELIVINRDNRKDNLSGLPGWISERGTGAIGKTYARAEGDMRGYFGPGIDGLQTYYPSDPSDKLFGPNPMAQMSVIDLKVSYDDCFAPAPAVGKPDDIETANRAAIA
jgi:hypothetical protein